MILTWARFPGGFIRSFFLAACFLAAASCAGISARAQDATSADSHSTQPGSSQTNSAEQTYAAQRKFAMELFVNNRHLEALPIFESLARQKPDDADVLFGWGVCLLDHSATLTDEDAARQERIRSRQLLWKAKELGNHSPLLMNLLEMLPEGGTVVFSKDVQVNTAMKAGESAFAQNNYDEAIEYYSRAFSIDPKSYEAALFIGDSYFAKKNFPNAQVWYERAIQIDPDKDTAYRYESDMFAKNGEMAKARDLAIKAIVANPYSQVTWRALGLWAAVNKLQLNRVHVKTPDVSSEERDGKIELNLNLGESPATGGAWLAYSGERMLWRKEKFAREFPKEQHYRHTLKEESSALDVAASVLSSSKKKEKKEIEKDPDASLLLKLYEAKMIEPYVLLSAADKGIAQDYWDYRQQNRAQLEAYLSQFVAPPAPK